MSVPYGGQAYGPPRQVNFGWIGESWQYVSQAIGVWIVSVLIFGVIGFVIAMVIAAAFHNPYYVPSTPYGGLNAAESLTPAGRLFNSLFEWLYWSWVISNYSAMAVKQVKTGQLEFRDIFSGSARYAHFLLLYLIVSILSFIGILLLCFGLFVVLGLLLPVYPLTADGEPAMAALSKSFAAMSSNWLPAAGLALVVSLIVLVSALPCGLGLLVTVPMTFVIMTLAYRDMIGFEGGIAGAYYGQPNYGQTPPGSWPPAPGQTQPPFGQQPPYGQQPQAPYGQQPQPPYGQPQPPYGQQPPPPTFGQPPAPGYPPNQTPGGTPPPPRGEPPSDTGPGGNQ